MKVALDTNVLLYAEAVNTPERGHEVNALLAAIGSENIVVPVQALGELFNVLTRKAGWLRTDARSRVVSWRHFAAVAQTKESIFAAAVDLATDHGLTIWDAIILAAAAEAGCSILLSEDMQHGFTWRGLTVVNPFVQPPHPLLAEAIGG